MVKHGQKQTEMNRKDKQKGQKQTAMDRNQEKQAEFACG